MSSVEELLMLAAAAAAVFEGGKKTHGKSGRYGKIFALRLSSRAAHSTPSRKKNTYEGFIRVLFRGRFHFQLFGSAYPECL